MSSVRESFVQEKFNQKSDGDLIKFRRFALAAIAEIADNLANPGGLSQENRDELQRSSDLLHSELGACAVLLQERGIEINNEGE